MEHPYAFPFIAVIIVFCLLAVLLPAVTFSQSSRPNGDTTSLVAGQNKIRRDSAKIAFDSVSRATNYLINQKKNDLKTKLHKAARFPDLGTAALKKDSFPSIKVKNPFKGLLSAKPALRISDGFVAYSFNFRANIDTPYVERDISQHNITGSLNFSAAGNLPFALNYWIRRSNSGFFKDITDVQLTFNVQEFQSRLKGRITETLLALSPFLVDSLTEKLLAIKNARLNELKANLQNSYTMQDIVEANEILNVPGITYDPALPDSSNRRRTDSLKKAATLIMDLYKRTIEERNYLSAQVDSLRICYERSLERIKRYRQIVTGYSADARGYRNVQDQLDEFGLNDAAIPARYRWLLGVRNFRLGRAMANYTDLTAKNISVNGINFEYNSWYYFAVSAGLVDYRFRDFVVSPLKKTRQYLWLVRAGVGRITGNHVIISGFRGRKQLFSSTSAQNGISAITISGISIATRLNLGRNSFASAEVAESVSPDFRSSPPDVNTKFNFSDKTNNAVALRFSGYSPKTKSRIDAFYKYTGGNYQSFSSFQTNAAQKAWYVKAEQNFFKRQLRLNAAVRMNDYFNPFIVQQYRSNTVFKSITASFKKRKWPTVSVGYQPLSQFTKLDNKLIESRFQTLSSTLSHLYKIKKSRASTTIIYNRFFNTGKDTAFVYYNAINVYGMQSFFFTDFSAGIAASFTKNPGYRLIIMDENIQWHISNGGSLGFGFKVNNYRHSETIIKIGGYVSANIRIGKLDMLYLSFEKGYLPGYHHGLIRNDMGSIQFIKSFRF